MSVNDNCVIVCGTNDSWDCGCNVDGDKRCTGYCTCTGNRSRRLTNATNSPYVAYCKIVTSYKYNVSKNITEDIVCSQHTSNSEYNCSGVRNKATKKNDGTYERKFGGSVYNELITETDTRYKEYSNSDGNSNITTVKPNDLNHILGRLREEIRQRRVHTWYSGVNVNDVNNNVDNSLSVDNYQQNTPINILSRIKNIIKEKDDYANASTIKTKSKSVLEGDLIEATNLKNIEQDLFNINIDCICYADCTSFLVKSRRSCTCNIDCICNYW